MKTRELLLYARNTPALRPVYDTAKGFYHRFTTHGTSRIDVRAAFPLFRPFSGGSYSVIAPLTIQAVQDTVPSLKRLLLAMGHSLPDPISTTDYAARNGVGRPEELAALFRQYGSDKATSHDYYHVYDSILAGAVQQGEPRIMEVGLGTNNTDVASNMGIAGRPGASLRAFRDFMPAARVFGADIDKRILFTEDRIETYHADQTDPSTLAALAARLPDGFDLMIDDGLHSPNANLNTLAMFLGKLRPGGTAVVEDIHMHALELWQIVAACVPEGYEATLVRARRGLMFVVRNMG